MREIEYRFLQERDGVPIRELSAQNAPSIRFQSSAGVMRSLSGTFSHVTDANWFRDRIRVQMMVAGQWNDLGVFVVSSVSEAYKNGASLDNIDALDEALLVKQVSTEGILHLNAGEEYAQVIQRMLMECGIDALSMEEDHSVLMTDREDWDEGTSYLTVINALLTEINFTPLWFDESGIARMTRFAEPGASSIQHTFYAGKDSVIADDCTISQDIYAPYNVFKVIVSNADLEQPMTAVAVNESPTSPISTIQLGRRVMAPIVKLDNISSQEALQAYADRLRFESQLAEEAITFTTANLPGHRYLDTVALSHERLSGIYQETEWMMQLAYSGKMTHRAKRILYL